jgi:hypothetical protein
VSNWEKSVMLDSQPVQIASLWVSYALQEDPSASVVAMQKLQTIFRRRVLKDQNRPQALQRCRMLRSNLQKST